MSDKSKIEWCDATWNVVTGCTKVSAGCKHCYAERQWPRLSANPGTAYYSRIFSDVQCHPEKLTEPLRWKKPRRIFVCSMGDLFHPRVPFEFIDKVFAVMALAHWHIFIVLTKRPERMREYCNGSWQTAIIPHLRTFGRVPEGRSVSLETIGQALRNVHLGVSAEDQKNADERMLLLLDTPAAVRIVSVEPLLGPVFILPYLHGIHQVIAGGESGPQARPSHPEWFRSLRDQCTTARVAFNFKQWGEWAPRSKCYHTLTNGHAAADIDPGARKWPCIRLTERGLNGHDIANMDSGDDAYVQKVGKKLAGRMLDGVIHDEYPEVRP